MSIRHMRCNGRRQRTKISSRLPRHSSFAASTMSIAVIFPPDTVTSTDTVPPKPSPRQAAPPRACRDTAGVFPARTVRVHLVLFRHQGNGGGSRRKGPDFIRLVFHDTCGGMSVHHSLRPVFLRIEKAFFYRHADDNGDQKHNRNRIARRNAARRGQHREYIPRTPARQLIIHARRTQNDDGEQNQILDLLQVSGQLVRYVRHLLFCLFLIVFLLLI